MNFQKVNSPEWMFYLDVDREMELTNNCGKWMCFFGSSEEEISFAKEMCEKSILTGSAIESKHTNEQIVSLCGSGVCCFYCNGDDVNAHKKIISFFLENGMIRKTKAGKLFNISFKYDSQTHNDEYGEEFESKIKLKDFLNLETGEWLPEIKINK